MGHEDKEAWDFFLAPGGIFSAQMGSFPEKIKNKEKSSEYEKCAIYK